MPTNLTTIVKCQDVRLSGLTCAYTGRQLEVTLMVSPRTGVRYFVDGSAVGDIGPYSHKGYLTAAALMTALSQRDGVGGVVEGEKCLVCPYTGAALRIVLKSGLYRAEGGWNPYLPQPGPEAFAYYARMRGGIPAAGTVAAAPKIRVMPETVPLRSEALKDKYAATAAHMTESFVKGVAHSTTVSVPEGMPVRDGAPVIVDAGLPSDVNPSEPIAGLPSGAEPYDPDPIGGDVTIETPVTGGGVEETPAPIGDVTIETKNTTAIADSAPTAEAPKADSPKGHGKIDTPALKPTGKKK